MNENDRMWVFSLFALLLEFLIFSTEFSFLKKCGENVENDVFATRKKVSRNEIVYVIV